MFARFGQGSHSSAATTRWTNELALGVVAESHAEGAHHLGRAKRWGVYLTGGMVALALSLMLFTAIHLGIGVDPAEAKGALLIRIL